MENAIETIEHKGFTIKIYQDTDAESPREWENVGTMYCEHRRYTLGDKDAENPFVENEETGKWELRDDIAVALPLYLIDHSGLGMSVSDYNDSWDSGQVGVIYATKDKVKKEYGDGPDAVERAKNYMKGEVKTYDDYLRGNVYGYVVEDAEGNHIDSCWGFFPDDMTGKQWSFLGSLAYMIDEAKSAIDNERETEKESEAMMAL